MVKDMKASFGLELENYARFFEEVGVNIAAGQFTRVPEMDPDEFSKAGGVVVTGRFCVSLG